MKFVHDSSRILERFDVLHTVSPRVMHELHKFETAEISPPKAPPARNVCHAVRRGMMRVAGDKGGFRGLGTILSLVSRREV